MVEDYVYDTKPFHLCWNSFSTYMNGVNKTIANVK